MSEPMVPNRFIYAFGIYSQGLLHSCLYNNTFAQTHLYHSQGIFFGVDRLFLLTYFNADLLFKVTRLELLASNFHNYEPVLIKVFYMCHKHVCFCIFSNLLYKQLAGGLRSQIK